MPRPDDSICTVCGEEVPPHAVACPACGADETTGWSDQAIYDGTGIEDPEEFDHADWERRELGGPRRASWWVRGAILLVLLIWLVFWLSR